MGNTVYTKLSYLNKHDGRSLIKTFRTERGLYEINCFMNNSKYPYIYISGFMHGRFPIVCVFVSMMCIDTSESFLQTIFIDFSFLCLLFHT